MGACPSRRRRSSPPSGWEKSEPSFFRLLDKHEMRADSRSGGSRKPASWEEADAGIWQREHSQEAFIAALRIGEE
jgi:hypothetical protein